GTKAQYTVTAEGEGWRIVDSVAGRDGSTWVESVKVLRSLDGNTTTKLDYPPAGSMPEAGGAGSKGSEALVSPLADDDLAPLVLPGLNEAATVKAGDRDAFVLPALDDDQPLVLPGLETSKAADEPMVLPGTEA